MSYYIIPLQMPLGGLGQPPGASLTPPYCGSIRGLQQMLYDLGYYAGPVDGLYGRNTELAAAEFKRVESLGSGGINRSDCERMVRRWNDKMAKPPATPPPTELPGVGVKRALMAAARVHMVAPSPKADTALKEEYDVVEPGMLDRASAWWSAQGTATKAAIIGGGVAVVGGTFYLMSR